MRPGELQTSFAFAQNSRLYTAQLRTRSAAMAEMGIYEAMKTLKAVRKLRPDPIPDQVLRRVLEAATWAPTGGNRQPWRIVLVKDHAKKHRLGELYARSWKAYVGPYYSAIPA